MAPVKERLNNIVINRNFTNVVVKIILTVILFSKISNAFFDYNQYWCPGKPVYTLSFDIKLAKDFPTISFKKNYNDFSPYTIQNNPVVIRCNGPSDNTNRTAYWEDKLGKFNICGASSGLEPTFRCSVSLITLDEKTIWTKTFIAFGDFCNHCKNYQGGGCIWKIRKDHPSLYSPITNKYVQYDYE
ncbi:hypothetical protein MtrunA17_Chr8g0340331 [Medicago truncatula]|uniref:Transmembrane protein, putative n=1 Tax=Medicago truncatula TaxID=3880 RepID=G7LFX5_MEDTR|nr:transmembrane protein, putative [Medicago truncatula]RHN39109.1 hypothetical protein MtrunA17_Chr8g0340331 [Medicago truncatula]